MWDETGDNRHGEERQMVGYRGREIEDDSQITGEHLLLPLQDLAER